MYSSPPVPLWLWRAARWGLCAALTGIIALAAALSLGLADPPRAGPLLWSDDFKQGTARWDFVSLGGIWLTPEPGALLADFTAADQWAAALASAPAGDLTLEMGGAQTAGEIGAAYGLVFGWQDAQHYSAVLVNGNGYAEAYRVEGGARRDWFAWQQWPHILVGNGSNRVRVDVRGARVTVRVNDEVVVAVNADAPPPGRLGLLARAASAPAQVVFNWVKVWASSP